MKFQLIFETAAMQKISFLGRLQRALQAFLAAFRAPTPPMPPKTPLETADTRAALQLLALFQRDGRLLDFLQQDLADASDADIGAAVRVVHAGCRKALNEHVNLVVIRSESEGDRVTIPADYDRQTLYLTGHVTGDGPFHGTLIHPGWRVATLTLPQIAEGVDLSIVAPAEVEL